MAKLGIGQLGDVLHLLRKHQVDATRYHPLGLSLGLSDNTLKVIERDHRDDTARRLSECLGAWLRKADSKDDPSWDILIAALRSIGEQAGADGIDEEIEGKQSQAVSILSAHQISLSQFLCDHDPVFIIVTDLLNKEKVLSNGALADIQSARRSERRRVLLAAVREAVQINYQHLETFGTVLYRSSSTNNVRLGKIILKDYRAQITDCSIAEEMEDDDQMFTTDTPSSETLATTSPNVEVHIPQYMSPKFSSIRASFGRMFYNVRKIITKSPPPLEKLKVFLEDCFHYLESLLADINDLSSLLRLIKKNCTLIDIELLDAIVQEFTITEAERYIEEYKTTLKEFCQSISIELCLNERFEAVKTHPSLRCETATYVFDWKPEKHKLQDIKDILSKASSKFVKIKYLEKVQSITVTCTFPYYLTGAVLAKALEGLEMLKSNGLMQLTIGYCTMWKRGSEAVTSTILDDELEDSSSTNETEQQHYTDKETAFRASYHKELTMRQQLEQRLKEQDDHILELERNAARTKSVIKDTTAHFEEEIKKKDEEIDTYAGQLSHIGTELEETKKILEQKNQELTRCKEEKDQVIAELKSAVEERSQTVTQLRKQFEDKGNADAKQVAELVEKLEVKEQECEIYKMDFETERNDRQKLNQTLTDQLEQVTGQCEALKLTLTEAEHDRQQLVERNKKLEDELATLKELVQPLTEEADKVKNFEEEIQILTAQVNAYSRKGDELKRALTQSQERYKTLETDKKTSEEQLENQLTILRGELESKEYSLNQEQARVTSLQQEVSKLQDLSERTKKANKTLVQKLKESQQQSTAPISKSPTASPHMHGRADNMAHSSVPPPTQYGSEIPPTQYKAEDLLTRSEDPPTQYSPDPPTQYRAEGPPNHKPNLSTRRNPNSPIAPADVQQPKTQTDNSEGQIVVPSSQPEGDSRSSSNRNSDTLDVLPQFTKEQMSRRFKQTQSDKETDTALKELDEMRKTYSARPLTGPIPNNAPVGSQTVAQKPVKPRDDSNIKGEQTKDDPLPYDPNLVCPKCGKRFHIGGVQKFRHHVKNKCPGNSSAD